MKKMIRFALLFLLPLLAQAQAPIPKDLEGWQSWVLDGQEFRRCPVFMNTDPNDAQARVCAWPSRLTLDLTASGGRFAQSWEVFHDSWVTLPGSMEHWPRNVTVNGKPGAVVAHDGAPQLRLGAGTYAISGSFAWETRPESLPIPAQTGLVALQLDGRAVAQADRPSGAVWLGKRRGTEQVQGIDVQVFRLLSDDLPAILTTRLRLQVAGDAREEMLSTVLPAGFTPMALNSALPARIDADGRLRVQARAGSWDITLVARGADSAQTINVPAANGLWPKQEIWGFAANDRLRVAAVEGAQSIDPAQANVPAEWRQFPSFRLLPGGSLRVAERSRGLSAQDGNRLTLRRSLYLDFDHQGYTLADQITGQLRTGWRLDMSKPYRLASATRGSESLLVTDGEQGGTSGVELRSPQLKLTTLARLEADGGRVPATGWQQRFDSVSGELNLPPGHRLLAALGADASPGAWIEQWGLMDLFLLLITAAIALRLFGVVFALTTLAAVALVHQENSGIVWLLLAVMVSLVALRVAPAGRVQTVVSAMRSVLLVILLLVLVPFAISQVRYALYPQLADYGSFIPVQLDTPAPAAPEQAKLEETVVTAQRVARPAAVNAPPAEPAEEVQEELPQAQGTPVVVDNPYGLNAMWGSGYSGRDIQNYAPGTLVQAGPGRPQWRFVSYPYSWNGPVEASESVRFVILTSGWVAAWRVLGVALLAWVFFGLARSGDDLRAQWRRLMASRGAAAAMIAACIMTAGHVQPVRAEGTPDPQLLSELRTRLTRPPECMPSCVDILAARVSLEPGALDAQLEVTALANVAVALPSAANRFEPESVTIDGAAVAGVYRDSSQQYWIALKPGVHQVRIAGRLPPAESIQLVFPQVPHAISVDGSGWDVSGINQGRLLANTLELVRRKATIGSEASETSAQFAPFVRVHRQVALDLDWAVRTTIQRLAPEKGGFTLHVPLLPGESVLTPGIEAKDGKVLVGFDSSAPAVAWQSALKRSDALTLTAPKDAAWIEVWSFNVSPMWRGNFTGLPAVLPENVDASNWTFEYHPRPGESLKIGVTRPAAAKGDSLAIDNASLTADVGKRATEVSLELSYRSTQGGRHVISLPPSAQVTEVNVDGTNVPVRPEKGELPLAVLPGSHRLHIRWQENAGVGMHTQAPAVDLKSPSSNIRSVLRLPADRWVLYAGGAGVGPAILYWGELLVFVIVAVLLSRSSRSPLKVHEWLLLGLGLSTFSWVVLLLFAAWQFALRWRAEVDASAWSRRRFNAMQVVLIVLSASAVLSLVSAIPNGLLATPDMRIAGFDQSAAQLTWFNDMSTGPLPAPWVLSVSLWWYKLAMLLWALWLAFALVRWLPQAWRALSAGGIWRMDGETAAPTAPAPNPGD